MCDLICYVISYNTGEMCDKIVIENQKKRKHVNQINFNKVGHAQNV